MLKASSPNQTPGTTAASTETNGANAHWASLTWKSQSEVPTGTDRSPDASENDMNVFERIT